ncbi:MAG: hypothetical protein PHI37_01395 [Candidatus Gracilibacteria bacterium]|nr:hypothetical protein [Candidatus Gracilibacteria bacterium]
MDKMLDNLEAYIKSLEDENYSKIFFKISIIYIPLLIIIILGFYYGNNELLQEMAIFSFYGIIIITFLMIITFGKIEGDNENKNAKEKLKILIEKEKLKEIILKDIQDKFENDFKDYKDPRTKIRKTLQKLTTEDGFLSRIENGRYKLNPDYKELTDSKVKK